MAVAHDNLMSFHIRRGGFFDTSPWVPGGQYCVPKPKGDRMIGTRPLMLNQVLIHFLNHRLHPYSTRKLFNPQIKYSAAGCATCRALSHPIDIEGRSIIPKSSCSVQFFFLPPDEL